MGNKEFDVAQYYSSYPQRIILRPGYPARAQYKSTLLWSMFGKDIIKDLKEIKTYADIGGCFGFGANSMAYQIWRRQGYYPQTKVFEISADFLSIGKLLFPYIDWVEESFDKYICAQPFDLVTMFDVIEHLEYPEAFLTTVAKHTKYALLCTPMAAPARGGSHVQMKRGQEHPDGHINFYNPKTYRTMLLRSGLEIIKGRLISSIAAPNDINTLFSHRNSRAILFPEELPEITLFHRFIKLMANYPYVTPLLSSVFGVGRSKHLCLARSKIALGENA